MLDISNLNGRLSSLTAVAGFKLSDTANKSANIPQSRLIPNVLERFVIHYVRRMCPTPVRVAVICPDTLHVTPITSD